jgi:Deacetylase PdaC/Protein of unknown function (DUF3298)
MKKLISIAIVFILIINACKNTGRNIIDLSNDNTAIPYEIKKIDTSWNNCKMEDKKCAHLLLSYPIFISKDSSLNNYLNAEVNKMILRDFFYEDSLAKNETIGTGINNFFKEYLDISNEGGMPWEREIEIKINGRYKNNICLYHNSYEFLGGAHPNSFISYHNYDAINLKPLNTKDFIDINNIEFLKLGEKEFRTQNAVADTMSLLNAGYFWESGEDTTQKPGVFRYNENMSLTKDSIGFFYNSYEIACYAQGPSGVDFPIKNIQKFLKKKP